MDAKKKAELLAAEGKCIICLRENLRLARGLCPKHYQQFFRKIHAIPEGNRSEFDDACVAAGRILPTKRPDVDDGRNVFEEIWTEKFLAEQLAADLTLTPEQAQAEGASPPGKKGKPKP